MARLDQTADARQSIFLFFFVFFSLFFSFFSFFGRFELPPPSPRSSPVPSPLPQTQTHRWHPLLSRPQGSKMANLFARAGRTRDRARGGWSTWFIPAPRDRHRGLHTEAASMGTEWRDREKRRTPDLDSSSTGATIRAGLIRHKSFGVVLE